MFGYIYVNEQELKLREYTAYRSFYCGLCRNLHQRYGRTAQMMLNYDLTFLALLMTGLYEPDTNREEHRCIVHPVKKHLAVSNEAIDYAADMCVLLSYQKLRDDWEDEHKQTRRAAAALLKSAYAKAARKYPRQTQAIEKNIRLLHEAERKILRTLIMWQALPDTFLRSCLSGRTTVWKEELGTMGFYLGKFIYLMDALEDMEQDRKSGNYNIFAKYGLHWGTPYEKKIHAILTDMMIQASRAFERLPVLENAEILRNILYSGVWCKYASLKGMAESGAGKSWKKSE